MTPSKWNVAKVALWGALASPPLLAARLAATGDPLPSDTSQLIGFLIGGVIAGAILFAVMAVIRNYSLR